MKHISIDNLFLFCLLLSVTVFTALSQEKATTYYVLPNNATSTDCPTKSGECHTLSYYASTPYFASNSIFVLLKGEHLLEWEFALEGFDSIFFGAPDDIKWNEGPNEFTMQSPVTVRCTNDSFNAFYITLTRLVIFARMTITGCHSAVAIQNVSYLYMDYMSIQNSTYYGLVGDFAYGTNNLYSAISCTIYKTSFYQNCIRPPIIATNNTYERCSHMLLGSDQHHDIIFFNISHSNFTFGVNQYASVNLFLIEINPSSINNGKHIIAIFNCMFVNNTVNNCGGLFFNVVSAYTRQWITVFNSAFMYNRVINTTTDYTENYIKSSGGLCFSSLMHEGIIIVNGSSFIGNIGGGASVYIIGNGSQYSSVMISNCVFSENVGDFGAGFSIVADKFSFVWIVNVSVVYNKNTEISTGLQYSAVLFLCTSRGQVLAINNIVISHNNMTGLLIVSCTVHFIKTTSTVSHNTSPNNGGGIWVDRNSFVKSLYPGKLLLAHNKAQHYGGAIYSESDPFTYQLQQVTIRSKFGCPISGIIAVYVNNTAALGGHDVYGGQFYHCFSTWRTNITDIESIEAINCSSSRWLVFANISAPLSSYISSAPFGVCLCEESVKPSCNVRSIWRQVYPGSVLSLSLVTVGMCGGISPGQLTINEYNINVTLGSSNQMTLPWVCKTFTYKLNQVESLVGYFSIKTGNYELRNASIVIRVQFLDCPPGLTLTDSGTCDCNSIISSISNLMCNVSWVGTPIRRSGSIWLAYNAAYNCSILNDVCPFDYCNSSSIYLSLDDPDTQCALNRSGVLCGGCQPGLSLMLGSNKCQYCSSKYLSLLIGFIMAGIVLVAFLLVCNLTVSVGSINGLLFYANIVKLNEVALFPNGASMPVLSQFIAWINLDLGIETCFFNGLDGYWKTWLQFIFPVYIWLLVGAIIIGSYYSGRLSRIFGNNTVPVLATLILMSYSKLLRTITNALMISNIKCKDNNRRVWSVDANIDYLNHKHMILFGVSVAFLMVGLLYGGMIFSIQWLQKCTGRYCRSSRDPIVKLKPLVDSYTGPYKDRYRYWTGLLVFIRVILTALFSYTTQTKPEINNYIIVFLCVLLIRIAAKGVYRNAALNNLEFFHYFNLLCISILNALSHQEQWTNESLYFTTASISFSMILFIGTVFIHIYIKLENKYGRPKCLKSKFLSNNEEEYRVDDYHRLMEEEEYGDDSDREGSPPRIIQRRESMIFDFHIEKQEKKVESTLI